MRSTKLAAAVAAGMLLLLPFIVRSVEERRLAVFFPGGHFTIPVIEFDRTLYVPLQSVLEHLGPIRSNAERDVLRLRFKNIEGEFPDNTTRIRVGRVVIHTSAPVRLHQGSVLIPINALPLVITNYGAGETELHESGRRLFIGGVQQVASTAVQRDSGLVLEFPAPVSPRTSTDGNKIQLVFSNEPVAMNVDRVDYTDKLIKDISFVENNGVAEITVEGAAPLLASFSGGGRVITFTAAPAPAAAAPPPIPETQPAAPTSSPSVATTEPTPTPAIAPPPADAGSQPAPFLVIIDASHGGSETGVRFSDKLLEKEITLALARRLQSELRERGVASELLRNDDSDISADQRAISVNEKRPSIYVSLHAGGPGTGVRVYTALMSGDTDHSGSLFVPWDNAHQAYITRSRAVANSIVTELGARKINAGMMPAAVAPLKAIAAPAIAIELAPPPDKSTPEALTTPAYQSAVVEAVAAGVLHARAKAAQPNAEVKK